MATITITVTVANPGSGNKYYLDGVLQATYVATPGNTYKFDQADNSNDGHPLRLSITSDGTHNSGSAYTTGVTTNGTPGSAGAYTQIEVTATTVQALYYYCTAHSGMGGSFNTGSSETVQYQDRKGFDIQNSSSDFTSVGQIYYDSSSGQFKTVNSGGAPIGSWASGGNLNIARYGNTGSGDGNTSITTGGYADSGTPAGYKAFTEQYNGTSWTEVNDLNSARGFFGGTNSSPYTASLVFGGASPPALAVTEEWDGSSWTEVADLSTARINNGGLGANAENALCIGGSNPGALDKVESWNGSSWTEVAEFSTNRAEMPVGAGTNTAAIIYGGQYPPGVTVTANTESWNGSSWTEVNNLNVAKGYHGGGGSQTTALAYGGRTSSSGQVATTESWDGTSWTEVADLATARYQGMGASTTTNSSAILTGGAIQSAPLSNVTEEWAAADFEIKTVTTS